ncbi:MAG: HAD family hydrolase [Pirellulales bacterium]|nr:HAD family hydrolase [Pirellulales bacterium]
MRWLAVVFDLDDTLFPERQFVDSGMRAVADWGEQVLQIPAETTLDELRGLIEQHADGRTFNRWLANHHLDPEEWVHPMVQVYRKHEPTLTPYDDVSPVLQKLRRTCRLGVVTDGYLEVQQRKMAATGLEDRFDAIVYSDELGRDAWKPSTKPFELVLQRLGVAPDEAVYVGDNPTKDFRGARQLGMETIRIRRPDGLYGHLKTACPEDAPHWQIATLTELVSLMEDTRA